MFDLNLVQNVKFYRYGGSTSLEQFFFDLNSIDCSHVCTPASSPLKFSSQNLPPKSQFHTVGTFGPVPNARTHRRKTPAAASGSGELSASSRCRLPVGDLQ